MRITLASRYSSVASLLSLSLLVVACAGGSNGGSGTGGRTSTGTGGSTTGSGGASQTGGSTGTGGVSSTGTGGTVVGTGGSQTGGSQGSGGLAGSTGGTTGAAGASGRYACPSGPFTAPDLSSLTPTRVQGIPPSDSVDMYWGFGIIEGPVWYNGALYVSEIAGGTPPPYSRILSVSATGVVSSVFPDSGTNGMAIDTMGRLIGADHKVGGIVAVDLTDMTLSTVVGTYNNARFNAPNDLTVRSDGTIYFSDTNYQAPSPEPQGNNSDRIYRLPPGSTTAVVVDSTRNEGNGVTLSLDEKTLYVTDKQGLYQYPVNADGSVGTATQIAQSAVTVGDGMAIDCMGNLYVASNGSVIVVSSTGTSIGSINLSSVVQSVSNVAFGGADHQTLYITALGNVPSTPGTISSTTSAAGLFQVHMPLPGMPY